MGYRHAMADAGGQHGLALTTGTDNHGWGYTAPAWTLMRPPQWRGLSGDELTLLIERVIREAGFAGTLAIERVVAYPASGVELALTVASVPLMMFRTLSTDERRRVADGVRDGRYRLLYVSPERLVGENGNSFRTWLSRCHVSFIAVDEAHCISQWGHDFRPEYRQLASLRAQFPQASLHAFTATATARVRRDIVSQLALQDPVELIGSFDRPNLLYRVLPRQTLKRQLQDVLARHTGQGGIVYCTSRREVEALAAWLSESGVRARPYHAGLDDRERHRNQDAFLDEEIDVIVATVAFGMGIDRSDVRFVVHAGAPQSLEHYQQESGRAGRDGLEAGRLGDRERDGIPEHLADLGRHALRRGELHPVVGARRIRPLRLRLLAARPDDGHVCSLA